MIAGPGLAVAQPAAGDVEAGRKVYDKACAECHGPTGRGDGAKAKRLGFFARDFSLGAFKCRCTPTGSLPTDEDLFRTVSVGLPGTPMTGHASTLSEAERRDVVRFIKTLSPKFAGGNAPACAAGPAPPPASPELIAEGKALYRLMQCSKCHGDTGRGNGPAAATLKDDWGRAIKPRNFVVLKAFTCGNGDADLYRTLRTGMTGSPMPSYDAALVFGRDAFPSDALATLGSPADAAELAGYLQQQPETAAIQAMPAPAREELIDRRTWALVRYVRSLLAR
jgi:cytochrome c oxidase cbb3-type subunit 2